MKYIEYIVNVLLMSFCAFGAVVFGAWFAMGKYSFWVCFAGLTTCLIGSALKFMDYIAEHIAFRVFVGELKIKGFEEDDE